MSKTGRHTQHCWDRSDDVCVSPACSHEYTDEEDTGSVPTDTPLTKHLLENSKEMPDHINEIVSRRIDDLSVPTDTRKPNIQSKTHAIYDAFGSPKPTYYTTSESIDTPPTPDQPQADEDSARRRQEFADAGIYPDTDELEEALGASIDELTVLYQADIHHGWASKVREAHRKAITREREQAKREVLEAMQNDRYFEDCHGCSCDAYDLITEHLEALTPNEPKEAE